MKTLSEQAGKLVSEAEGAKMLRRKKLRHTFRKIERINNTWAQVRG